ncbi:MAG: hypothetical protein QXL42_03905 [Candidatus Caldarchaeum sp.]
MIAVVLADDPTVAVVGVALVFIVFYTMGSIAGRRRVAKLYTELSRAVDSLGGKVVGGRSGATAAVLSCKDMGSFVEFSIVIGIQSWANPLTYLVSRLTGRKDLVVLRAKLAKKPALSYTLINKKSPAVRYRSRWGRYVGELDEYIVVSPDKLSLDDVSQTYQAVKDLDNLLLLSLSRDLPNLHAYIDPNNKHRIKDLLYILIKLI